MVQFPKRFKKPKLKSLTYVFYGAVGVCASLALFLLLYWMLRVDSSISTFITSTSGNPLYFWSYVGLTLGMLVLFGVNASLLAYRIRKYGLPNLKIQTSAGLSSIFALFASACPVCGSTLLAGLGIAGGLAAFPLQGLEFKIISFFLMAFPVWLTIKDIKNKGCANGVCPVPKDASFKKKDLIWLGNLFLGIILASVLLWNMLKYEPLIVNAAVQKAQKAQTEKYQAIRQEAESQLFPNEGIHTRIVLADTIPKMVTLGIIDLAKFKKQYEAGGGVPQDILDILEKPMDAPLVITKDNQSFLVTILWPLGLANKFDANKQSPILTNLFSLASTGGWTLGREKNGGTYFNKYNLIPLTSEQGQRVKTLAESIYRPCCNNSTFYQDCNHGSAAMALIELGVAQGLSDEEIYKTVLAFNSYWFSQSYLETALFFKEVNGQDWQSLDPKLILSKDYSSGSGFAKNVHSEVAKIPGLAPAVQGGSSCST